MRSRIIRYLVQIAQTGGDIVLSTGMCEMDEIGDAIKVLEENWLREYFVAPLYRCTDTIWHLQIVNEADGTAFKKAKSTT